MNKNRSYEEVIQTIENTRRFGNLTGVEVSKAMLAQLGNPQSGIPFVHVAGTNGKGSTTAFLCEILQQSGKKIGMFTSPHLITFEERIRINGQYISKEDVTRLGNLLLDMEFLVSPTMFDYCLAMAVLYFKEQGCDICVIETGIGGRYDSTNALGVPEVAVITKIGFDHMAILGDTLEAIAGEKAGIIKRGCPVVVSSQEEIVTRVLQQEFEKVNNEACSTSAFYLKNGFHQVHIEDMEHVKRIPMKMLGGFQVENAATAMLAADELLNRKPELFAGVKVSQEDVVEHINTWIDQGIAQTVWKGRMEVVNENPFFLIDGAHNSHGVHALAEGLRELFPGEKFHFIMAVMADKDYEDMIEKLLPLAIDFVTVTPESNRALQSKALAECITQKGIAATYSEDMESVILPLLSQRNKCTKDEHKTIAFGSLYFIGAIEAMLEKNNK